jgi:hypothetical protein
VSVSPSTKSRRERSTNVCYRAEVSTHRENLVRCSCFGSGHSLPLTIHVSTEKPFSSWVKLSSWRSSLVWSAARTCMQRSKVFFRSVMQMNDHFIISYIILQARMHVCRNTCWPFGSATHVPTRIRYRLLQRTTIC